MSLYTFLGTPLPVIVYSVFHQGREGISKDEYLNTIRELHQRLMKETDEINASYSRHLGDVIGKESNNLQNSLASFLQTPISSDSDLVRREVQESFRRFKDQILDGSPSGISRSLEGRVFFVSSKKSVERKLLRNGKSYLEELGLVTVRGHPEIFESTFIVSGGMNLDILEHIVRDRLGIYSTTHGKHLEEAGPFSFAVYNLAFESGELPAPAEVHGYVELSFHFSKPEVKYAPFRNGMSEAIGKLFSAVALKHVSLWQRKLGLGPGREFILRIVTKESSAAEDIVEWLAGYEEENFVREAIIGGGSLVLKELLSTVGEEQKKE